MKSRLFSALCFGLITLISFSACKTTNNSTDPVSATQNDTAMNYDLPEIPPAKLFQHATPSIFQLDNGMTVWYVQNEIVPLMSLKVVFNRGASQDPADKSGLSSFTASMLKEGANGRTAQQISDDIEFIGATLNPNITQDAASITLQVMTQYFDKGLDILSDIWLKPDFTQPSFERLQKIIFNGLKQREDSPNVIAKLASNREYFGEDHPYSRSTDGYIHTIQNIVLNDIKENYQSLFNPNRAAIIAVGNLPEDQLKTSLNEHFGKISIQKTDEKPLVIPALPEPKLRVTIVDKSDAPQTVIRIYQPSVVVTSPETLKWQFVNIPLGGSFTSRLNQNIREDKGYSYGASSGVSPQKMAGVLLSASAVAAEATGPALKEFIYELSRVPKGDFTQEEFDRARETWKSELVQSFETQAGVLATISGLYLNGKSTDFINAFARNLDNLTLDDFNNYAKSFPTIDQATITLVGDKTLILEQIKDLNLPEPTIRDVEGKLLK